MRTLLGLAVLLGLGVAQPLPVAATTGFIGDMARNVGGERVRVSVAVPLGADPHSFEPRPSTLREVSGAQVLFANGLGLEPFLDKPFTRYLLVLPLENHKNNNHYFLGESDRGTRRLIPF